MVKVSLKAVQCSQINKNKKIIIKKKRKSGRRWIFWLTERTNNNNKKKGFSFFVVVFGSYFLVGWLVGLFACLFVCLFGFVVVRSHLRCRRGRRGRRRRRRNTTLPPDSAPSTCRWPSTSSPFRFLFFFCDSTASRSFFGG